MHISDIRIQTNTVRHIGSWIVCDCEYPNNNVFDISISDIRQTWIPDKYMDIKHDIETDIIRRHKHKRITLSGHNVVFSADVQHGLWSTLRVSHVTFNQ